MATELAKAYVQILPSMQGIRENLTSQMSGAAESAGRSAGSRIGGLIRSAIAAAGIGAALKESLTQGAALEQSLGGVETLFKDAADTVIANARNAYAEAGLSANAYMESITGFSARLLQGMGNDTEAAAAVAHMAMVDMSDNANKMGTDMQVVQETYQSLARGNYEMLDNLKLGYGGTQAELARLINDSGVLGDVVDVTAESVKNVPFDKVIEAIHTIQGNLGITGTTAQEAATTFTGSFSAMKAAAQNLLADLMLGNDLSQSLDAMTSSIVTFVGGNLLPALANILGAVPQTLVALFTALAPQLIDMLSNLIVTVSQTLSAQLPVLIPTLTNGVTQLLGALIGMLPTLVDVGVQLLLAVVAGITAAIPAITAAIPQIISALLASLPLLIDGAVQLFMGIVDAIPVIVTALVASLPQIIQTILDALIAAVPQLIDAAVQLMMALVDAIPIVIDALITALPQIHLAIVSALIDALPVLLEGAVTLFMALVDAIPITITTLIDALPAILDATVTTLLGQIPLLIEGAIQLFMGIVQALPQIITALVAALPTIVTTTVTVLLENLPLLIEGAVRLFMGIVQAIPQIVTELARAMPQIIQTMVQGLLAGIGDMQNVGRNLVQGLWNGISNVTGWVLNKIRGFGQSILNGIKNIFGIRSPSRQMAWVGQMLDYGLAGGIEKNTRPISDAIDEVTSLTTRGFENDLAVGASLSVTDGADADGLLGQLLAEVRTLGDRIDKMQIYLDSGALVGGIAPKMDAALGRRGTMTARGVTV